MLCGCQVVLYCRSISGTGYEVSGARYCSYPQHLGLYITVCSHDLVFHTSVDTARILLVNTVRVTRPVLGAIWVDTASCHIYCLLRCCYCCWFRSGVAATSANTSSSSSRSSSSGSSSGAVVFLPLMLQSFSREQKRTSLLRKHRWQ